MKSRDWRLKKKKGLIVMRLRDYMQSNLTSLEKLFMGPMGKLSQKRVRPRHHGLLVLWRRPLYNRRICTFDFEHLPQLPFLNGIWACYI